MVKKYLKFILITLILAVGLGMAAQAITDVTPANSVLNPVTETLYFVDNSAPQIKVYRRTATGWDGRDANKQTHHLPLPSVCYGLAVSADQNGGKLYVSVNAGSNSHIRVYDLDNLGYPVSSNTFAKLDADYWPSAASPAGMALNASRNHLYVAEKHYGGLYVFEISTGNFVDYFPGPTDNDTHFEIAVSGSKIYVSNKSAIGKIHVYQDNGGSNIAYNSAATITGLTYPTYVKVVEDKLYVAVNGTDGTDIKVYDTSNNSPIGNVQSSVVGSYGWTAFDIQSGWLFFKKSHNSGETTNFLYKIKTNTISGNVTADLVDTDTQDDRVNKSDGLAVSFDRAKAALSFSPTGAVQIVSTGSGNRAPDLPDVTDLKQYKLVDHTEIGAGEAVNVNQTLAEIDVTDLDPDGDALIPIVAYQKRTDQGWMGNFIEVEGPATVSGIAAVPLGTLEDGVYEWEAKVRDPFGEESSWRRYNNNNATADFIIDMVAPVTTILAPADGATVSGVFQLRARIDDSSLEDTIVEAAEYFIDTQGANGTGVSMDGPFDSHTVTVTKDWDSRYYSPGDHPIYIHGKDEAGNWGVFASVTVNIDNPAPTVTSVDPDNGVQGEAVVIINLIGTNFVEGATTVKLTRGQSEILADPNFYEYFGSTHIRCRIAIPLAAEIGPWNVVARNPDGQIGQLDDGFTIYAPGSAPVINSITPENGNLGATLNNVEIAGENFVTGATVKLARTGRTDITPVPGSVNVINANLITCDFSIPLSADPGVWTPMVTNPDGQTGSLVDGFAIFGGPPPSVISIDPNNGVQGETIAIINLIGTNFVDGAGVKLTRVGQSDIDASSVVVANSEYISCSIAIPQTAEIGLWNVVVTNPDTQSGQLDNAFTVYAPGTAPTITSIDPDNGDRDTTVSVTITGTNFDPAIADGKVKLARTTQTDIPADTGTINVVSQTEIRCDFSIPATAATGAWTVMVTNPDGQTGSLVDGFRVNAGATGQITYTLYHVDEGNLNWIALPFANTGLTTTIDLGEAIASTFPSSIDGDTILITLWDAENQVSQQTTGLYVGGTFFWTPDTGQPLSVGNMYAVSISKADRAPGVVFSTDLTISGDAPSAGSIGFDLYHVDEGNLNWISIPWYTIGLTNTVDLGDSIATKFTAEDGDTILITLWDAENQVSQQTTGLYVGGFFWTPDTGQPVAIGYPYSLSISRANRQPGEVFIVIWP